MVIDSFIQEAPNGASCNCIPTCAGAFRYSQFVDLCDVRGATATRASHAALLTPRPRHHSGDTTPAASYSNERNSSSLSHASLMIFFISQRGSSAECIGTTVVHFVSGFRNVMWLPFCRSISKPTFSNAAMISLARRPGSRASILCDDGRPHRNAEGYRLDAVLLRKLIAVICERFKIDRERLFCVRHGFLVGTLYVPKTRFCNIGGEARRGLVVR